MPAVASTAARRGPSIGSRWSPPDLAFGALLALGAAIVLVETRGLSFFADDWEFVTDRRGMALATLLRPHGPHLVVIPVLIYKVLLAVFGGRSYLPYRLLAALDLVLVALAVGIAGRARWGRWAGLVPVALLITLGPGSITLLWSFQVGYALAVAAGLAALLLIDVDTLRGDVWACLALTLSLASGSQGVGFVVGCAVMLVLRGRWRRRVWVVLIPAVLYALWYARYGHQYSETHLSLWNTSLPYFMQSLSATLSGLTGQAGAGAATSVIDPTFGVPLAVGALAGGAVALWRGWRPRSLFWGAAATLTVIWIAASMSNFGIFSRPANDPRYLSSNAALLLVCICVAVPRPRQLARGAIAVVGVVLVIVCATNASQYGTGHQMFETADTAARAELGALLLVRHDVAPTFPAALPGDPSELATVAAGPFFSADDAFGIAADSPEQLLGQSETTRELADSTLQRAEIAVSPRFAGQPAAASAGLTILGGTSRRSGACRILGEAPLVIEARPGDYTVDASRAAVAITMGRFASGFNSQIATVPAGRGDVVAIGADAARPFPWRMRLVGAGARVCAT